MPDESKFEKISISVLKMQVSELEKKVESGEFASFSDVSRAAYREYIERHPNNQIAASPAPCSPVVTAS